MSSNSKKPLYLGTCLDDLHKLGVVEIGKREDPEKHLKVAEKAFTKAEEFWIEGDEEKSFVLFMRYLNSIEGAKRTLDYSKTPKKFSVFISKDKFMTSISRGEVLKENLKKRYAKRREAEEKLNAVQDFEDAQLLSVPTHKTELNRLRGQESLLSSLHNWSQSTVFTPSTGDDVTFPPLKPKENFFKPRRAPPTMTASRPTRELEYTHYLPDTALDPEDSYAISDSIGTSVPRIYNTGNYATTETS